MPGAAGAPPAKPEEPLTLRIASALFEIEAGEPSRGSRLVLKTLSVLIVVLLVWACLAKLDIVAVAEGRLVPQTYVKIVQPAEAGIIREILVDEGDVVEAGQVLVRLDPTVNAADSVATRRELAIQSLQLRRLEAELSGRPMTRVPGDDANLFAQVDAQRAASRQSLLDSVAAEVAARDSASRQLDAAEELLEKLETTLPSYQRSADAYEKLAGQQLMGTLQADERRREALEKAQDLEAQRATVASLEATIAQHRQRISQLQSSYSNDLNRLRIEAVAAINRLEQQSGKLDYQQGLLELRAPQGGVVKELATTTLGAVVQPGTVILSLVPQNEPLLAEVSIENKDIGFVHEGQAVRVKLAAYPFQKYGLMEGTVKTVSADSSSQASASNANTQRREDGQEPAPGLSFKALVELREQKLAATSNLMLPLAAGMQVSAEIMQGERTVMEYLLSPVKKVTDEAARER